MKNLQKDKVTKEGRILYVEPNDIYGEVNGVPLTPDYSDYCVSFNLVVEVPSRFKGNTGTDKSKKYVLSWISSGGDTGTNHVSFLSGDEAENFNLTTYYTDIDFEDVNRKNIVEGLGIESISVSFDSYYVPTVSIKFIDVRGSSLFGREEATHRTNGLTADNVFGCFFTIPYPVFRLQIKGFYGKPVTYQLTCSKFNGNFNHQTGNFEAVANFIGYSYSLLTDVPLSYIAAAPYSKYYGEDYWNMKVDSKEWELADGYKPVKLFELVNKIKTSMSDVDTNDLISESEIEEKHNAKAEIDALNDILLKYNKFISSFKTKSESFIEDADRQILFLFDSSTLTSSGRVYYGKEVNDSHKILLESLNKYNNSFTSSSFIANDYPNEANVAFGKDSYVETTIFCRIEKRNGKISSVSLASSDYISKELIKDNCVFNDGRKLSDGIVDKLLEMMIPSSYDENLRECGYVLDLHNFSNKVKSRIENVEKRLKNINENVKKKKIEKQREILQIKPYIGNMVKIVMCHLETFTHMMYQCYTNIKNSDRSPSFLGVNEDLSNTDIVGDCSQIPPWPMCYNNGNEGEEGGSIDNSDNVIAWVKDFSDNFEEEKLISSLQLASLKGEEEKEREEIVDNEESLIYLPSDLNSKSMPFSHIRDYSISSLSGILGIRAINALVSFPLNTNKIEIAKLMGIMDAVNYYHSVRVPSTIKSEIIDRVGNGSLKDTLIGIMRCDSEYDSYGISYSNSNKVRHIFETVDSISDYYECGNRHPIVKKGNYVYEYVHYYMKNNERIIPSELKDFKEYSNDFLFNKNDKYFKPNIDKNDDTISLDSILYTSTTSNLLSNENVGNIDLNKVYNNNLFNILTNKESVDSVINRFNFIKNGNITIGNYSETIDFSEIINSFWVLNKSYSMLYDGRDDFLSEDIYNQKKNRNSNEEDVIISKDEMLPDSIDGEIPNLLTRDLKYSLTKFGTNVNLISYDSESETWKNKENNSVDLKSLHVYSNIISTDIGVSSNGALFFKKSSLFGNEFYYMQNNRIPDNEYGYSESDNITYEYRKNRVKCLLYLNTFNYNMNNPLYFLNKDRENGSIECVPYGYLLMLGGYLWRRKFMTDNVIDPIIYTEGDIRYKEAYKRKDNGFIDYVLKNHDGDLFCQKIHVKESLTTDPSKFYNIKVTDLLYKITKNGFDDSPDYPITNKLINLFDEFVKSDEWYNIRTNLELKLPLKKSFQIDFNAHLFIDSCKSIRLIYDNIDKKSTQYSDKNSEEYKLATHNLFIKYISGLNGDYFNGIIGNYSVIYPTKDNNLKLLISNNNKSNNDSVNLYTKKCVVLNELWKSNLNYIDSDETQYMFVKEDMFENYISGFCNELEKIVNANSESYQTEIANMTSKRRDISISMYMYIKNLWDKWLVNANEIDFTIDKYFSNFVFIDSFYKNIFKELHVNLNIFKKIFEERVDNKPAHSSSLYSFLGDLAAESHCLFLSMPDYINLGDDNEEIAVSNLEDIFRPIPYHYQKGIDRNNKFIFIYTHKPSENASEQNNYRGDSFDIWSDGKITESARRLFSNNTSNNSTDQINRYGYNVPSFGVAFSKQNNHLFKNIKLDMNNPMETEQSIKTLTNVAKLGSGASGKTMFIGQDIYPIFSNYSYFCEVEMMGDAQIMPLMYFQLMNIPMWRGTYMIFNVNHTITPGNMITTFKGMKMASNSVPYTKEWFISSDEASETGVQSYRGSTSSGSNYSSLIGTNIGILNLEYAKSDDNTDYWNLPENRAVLGTIKSDNMVRNGRTVNVSDKLIKLYNELYGEIKNLPENRKNSGKTGEWNVCLSHILRNRTECKSDHCYGLAMDLKVMERNRNNQWDYKKSGTYQKNLVKAMDILYCNHLDVLKQLLLEYKYKGDMNPSKLYNFNVLHVSVNDERNRSYQKPNIAIFADLSGNGRWGHINNGQGNNSWFLDNAPIEFVAIARRHYGKPDFFSLFTNYSFYSNDKSKLEKHFGIEDHSNDVKVSPEDARKLPYRLNNPGSLRPMKDEWLGQIGVESGFVKFDTMTHGTRALMLNVNTKVVKSNNKIDIRELFNILSPKFENETDKYIDFVCKHMQLKSDHIVPLLVNDKQFYKTLAVAIGKMEGGFELGERITESAYFLAKNYLLNK